MYQFYLLYTRIYFKLCGQEQILGWGRVEFQRTQKLTETGFQQSVSRANMKIIQVKCRAWRGVFSSHFLHTYLLFFPLNVSLHCPPLLSTSFSSYSCLCSPDWSYLSHSFLLFLILFHNIELNDGCTTYLLYFLKILDSLAKLENLLWFSFFVLF